MVDKIEIDEVEEFNYLVATWSKECGGIKDFINRESNRENH